MPRVLAEAIRAEGPPRGVAIYRRHLAFGTIHLADAYLELDSHNSLAAFAIQPILLDLGKPDSLCESFVAMLGQKLDSMAEEEDGPPLLHFVMRGFEDGVRDIAERYLRSEPQDVEAAYHAATELRVGIEVLDALTD